MEAYGYDELERRASVSCPNTHPGKDEDITYTYDTCASGKGVLCMPDDEFGGRLDGFHG